MKLFKSVMVLALMAGFSACATPKTLLLSTPAVSMTDSAFEPGTKFNAAGEIKSQFCRGEDAVSSKGDLNVGNMDELIFKSSEGIWRTLHRECPVFQSRLVHVA